MMSSNEPICWLDWHARFCRQIVQRLQLCSREALPILTRSDPETMRSPMSFSGLRSPLPPDPLLLTLPIASQKSVS